MRAGRQTDTHTHTHTHTLIAILRTPARGRDSVIMLRILSEGWSDSRQGIMDGFRFTDGRRRQHFHLESDRLELQEPFISATV